MKKKRAVTALLLTALVLGFPGAASAAGRTAEGLKSRGNFYFDNKTPDTADDICFYADDLVHLAGRIDVLTEVCR
ncbi:MAG: hypothetical protein MR430_05615 [Lachnospiraceae bacterium]|nr:hypothetical protein [Lachnospiraceae bacterium]